MKPKQRIFLNKGRRNIERVLNSTITDIYAKLGETVVSAQAIATLPSAITIQAGINTAGYAEPSTKLIEPSEVPTLGEEVVVDPRYSPPNILNYQEGLVTPQAGDAIHFETSDGLFYRANPITRRNLVGVKDGGGNIVGMGRACGLSGLTPNSMYYLAASPSHASSIITTAVRTGDYDLRQDANEYALSQSFAGIAGLNISSVQFYMYAFGTPTWDIYLELRDDSGGLPGNTVYARSEPISAADLETVQDDWTNQVYFRFLEGYQLSSGVTYHICIQAGTTTMSGTNYVRVAGNNTNPYASGKRCVQDSSLVWSDPADSTDLRMLIHGVDTSLTTGTNITTVHPFDSSLYLSHLPIYKLGRAASATELNVNIDRVQTIVLYSNLATEISLTGTTSPRLVAFSTISAVGVEKILVLWKAKEAVGNLVTFTPWWNGTAGTPVNIAWPNYNYVYKAQVFNTNLAGHNALAFTIDLIDASHTGYVSKVMVLGG